MSSRSEPCHVKRQFSTVLRHFFISWGQTPPCLYCTLSVFKCQYSKQSWKIEITHPSKAPANLFTVWYNKDSVSLQAKVQVGLLPIRKDLEPKLVWLSGQSVSLQTERSQVRFWSRACTLVGGVQEAAD